MLQQSLPTESDFQTPFFTALEEAIRRHDPEAIVVPYLSPGATDSRFFRAKGSVAYGIIPLLMAPEDLGGLHGKNERIPVKELQRGKAVLWDLVNSLQAAPASGESGK